MQPTRMLFSRGTLPPGIAGSSVVGALCADEDGTITAANDFFLRLAGRSRQELEAGALHWDALLGATPPSLDPWTVDFPHPGGRTVSVLVELVPGEECARAALVVDVSATRVAEQALTRAREVLEERIQVLDERGDAAAMAEKLTASEHALASANRDMHAATVNLETERQRVEELASRLANANRELDAFSYSVSHDLRTPLRSIDGFSRVLLSSYSAQLDDRGRDYLSRVRNATQRMSHLLDDLLKLARTSRSAFVVSTVDLSAYVQQLAADLQQREPGRRVTWKIEPGLTIRGDRTLLRVAIDNLLENAWKFTAKREEAVIEVGREGRVFFVRDNGAGFDMRYADQLFGVFQRLHTATEFEGTGIGLATVQRVIHRHDGEIWAEGVVDGGAVFHFTIGEKRPA